jgi:hypothetical protein
MPVRLDQHAPEKGAAALPGRRFERSLDQS